MLVSFVDSLRAGGCSDFVAVGEAEGDGDGVGAPLGKAVFALPVNLTASAYSVPEG